MIHITSPGLLRAALFSAMTALAPTLAEAQTPPAATEAPAAPAAAPAAPPPAAQAPAAPAPTAQAPADGAQPATAAPPARPRPPRPPPPPRVTALSTDPQPTYGPQTIAVTRSALAQYQQIARRGGWGTLPPTARLTKGQRGGEVLRLKQRLAAEGDLPAQFASGDLFDDATFAAVQRFQRRVGLLPSGIVAAATIRQLNIPVEARIRSLEKSLERLAESRFAFGPRYVIVNIPAAAAEAIEGDVVKRRHVVIVGKQAHASPMVETRLTVVNFNPTWTIPTSIIKRDIIPRMRRNPATLANMRVRILDRSGNEVNPAAIDWSTERAVNYTLRQDPGPGNSLGRVRIDMPNTEAVFMHDTPSRGLFQSDSRTLSSGCVRVADVSDFVTWLLGPQGFTKEQVVEGMTQTQRRDVRLTQAVPVAWVYLTGWSAPDGTVQFRDDIYGWDAPGAPPQAIVRPVQRQAPPPVEVAPQVQQAPPPPQNFFESIFGTQRGPSADARY
ncbi:L,D-transpeptidase family protein [Phreatobacter oligotrophus]|uniref:Murein L,D-transpeptidase YcbB/YkuD n=1 Tax=Phreatobacter oligotrophus TaxID=1122261 RepID=A0A2T4ZH03_9HYPH|nr:L,D-transpeptidase family protein [Phreatobacter oligotrophus]PTM61183.1 murein L,D-transpeptidase YcbB/YkuD [Phreatobacter oligotrophus]